MLVCLSIYLCVSVPPVGYLERIREICTKHDILLIFDEVITGFGRIGSAFATLVLTGMAGGMAGCIVVCIAMWWWWLWEGRGGE